MKILHLISSLKVGGAEALLVELIKDLQIKNIENCVIFFHTGSNLQKLKNLGVKCIQIKGLFKMYDPVFLYRLYKQIKTINPDCIHSSLWAANFLGTIFSKILKIPNICTLHLGLNLKNKKESFFRRILENFSVKKSYKTIAVSNSIKNSFENLELQKNIEVIENGIKILPKKDYCKARSNSSTGHSFWRKQVKGFEIYKKIVIGSVGRFIKTKNHQLLIEAFSELRKFKENIELHLIGHGPLEQNLKNLVSSLNLKNSVKFINTNEARSFYKKFDIFVLPSEQEGLSIALLEALSEKLPVVVIGQNFEHEVITHEQTGLVINLSKKELISSLDRLISNIALAQEIGLNGYNLVEKKYTLDRMSNDYITLYKYAISNSNRN